MDILEKAANRTWYERWQLEKISAYGTLEDARSILDHDIREFNGICQEATAQIVKLTRKSEQDTEAGEDCLHPDVGYGNFLSNISSRGYLWNELL